jgi:hypothetical protein
MAMARIGERSRGDGTAPWAVPWHDQSTGARISRAVHPRFGPGPGDARSQVDPSARCRAPHLEEVGVIASPRQSFHEGVGALA